MEDQVASKTAMITSLMRALHSRDDAEPLIDDPWGDKLLSGEAIASLQQHAHAMMGSTAGEAQDDRFLDSYLRASPAYTNVIVRTRYTEDALHDAISDGINQYVVIGAGLDSYSLRRTTQAKQLEIYEIDHPATQSFKQERLDKCDIPENDLTHYLPADLGKERLGSVLSSSTYRKAEPGFFSWLGVTMYLTRESNMALLQELARYAAPGSVLVFSYIDQQVFEIDDPTKQPFRELQKDVKAVGEPIISGFHPDALQKELLAVGLELVEDLDEVTAVNRYDAAGANDFVPAPGSHIARVRVLGSEGNKL